MTVYDFVRAFCDLLPSTNESSSGMPSTLLSKEDEAEEAERLRAGAEEIADLSSNGVCLLSCSSSGGGGGDVQKWYCFRFAICLFFRVTLF